MDKVYKLAVVGCGDVAQKGHFPSFSNNPRVQVIAVSDIDPVKAEQTARQNNVSTWSADYKEILSRGDVDAVFVLTPPHVSAKISIHALQMGKDVFCEKPMAIDMKEAIQVKEAIRLSGRKLQVGFKNIFSPLMEKLKQRIKEGWFGSPLVYRISSFDEVYNLEDPEHYHRIIGTHLAHGSPMIHEGAHIADWMRWFTDSSPPRRVMAIGSKSQAEFPKTNYTSALVEMSNGDVAQLECAWLFPDFFPGSITVMGAKGVANMSRAHKSLTFRDGKNEEVVHMTEDWNTICFKKQLDYFVRCLDDNIAPVPGLEEGIYSIRLTHAMENSLLSGEIVSFDL
ncbi:Gfo/Idh/MocA family protein [Paenibacillus solisilvae]|uniref:Gfo/Idh/MocA family protein n=1 Tax=Paenibacillus solisilvae TaxID=2486751 RepID=A0ABW0VXF5_9BACL